MYGMIILEIEQKLVGKVEDRERVRNLMGGHWINELEKKQWI